MLNTSTRLWQIAADTGGTFTDCHALSPEGGERRVKVLSSGCLRARVIRRVDQQSIAIQDIWGMPKNFFRHFFLRNLDAHGKAGESSLIENSASLEEELILSPAYKDNFKEGILVEIFTKEAAPILGARLLTRTPPGNSFPAMRFRLATTRATNALLERKGSRTALFITQGFGDLMLIGDQRRKDLFALRHEARDVHYEAVCEVQERLDAAGDALLAVDEAHLRETSVALVQRGITTAAVCLMHSDINPTHEQTVRAILLECGFSHVSLSSDLAPFIRILPRAQSTVANAYLTGPVEQFIRDVAQPLGESSSFSLMTSAGAIEPAARIRPKDLLLSGPAAGVLGALNAAKRLGHTRIITFDMGGTSTDVARVDGALGYRFHQLVGGITLLTPSVAIETVAAGGGSICAWTPSGLAVGPHSAGSDPGPACYGKGGPLTITDVNLLLERFDPSRAPIPLNIEAAKTRLEELLRTINEKTGRKLSEEELLRQLLALATEHMADAIRRISVLEGYDPAEYALLAFGGAGPQHACDVAERLGIQTILAPHHAGILSAVGLQEALPERFAQQQVLRLLDEMHDELPKLVAALRQEATRQLAEVTDERDSLELRQIAELRLRGQDTPLQIEFTDWEGLPSAFADRYEHLFGYCPPQTKPVELVSLRVIARPAAKDQPKELHPKGAAEKLHGPQLVQDAFSTLVIADGWSAVNSQDVGWVLRKTGTTGNSDAGHQAPASLDLMRHRFTSIVEEMGALLRRTALSTNIRERLDFSCALLDPMGRLITSAPHIPVHLGALGMCVREVMRVCELNYGDTIITNHPAFGGSHLPDVTLITPVFGGSDLKLLGFVANRAHHAEIGGLSPGSMPANATRLVEEGVVIAPMHLCRAGHADFDSIRRLLQEAPYPTRAIEDNIADLHAQLAANRLGVERMLALCQSSGNAQALLNQMQGILGESRAVMRDFLPELREGSAQEELDDGSVISVSLIKKPNQLAIDFTGSSPQHPANLNATAAIVRSAVLYVLRLVLNEDLPLNEGLLEDVEIVLPKGSMLNPTFDPDPSRCPAVVGGNVEISQRVVDTLLKALGAQACSQGTMNNFLFGSERFGYYETIGGGAGAGDGYDGASGLHTHMTNTAITDPEIIERRYPVRVREFSLRHGSGGIGKWKGGDGLVRQFEFLETLTVSLLTQHRTTRPYGMAGGSSGASGRQTLIKGDSSVSELASSATLEVQAGERLRLETPGGGGWGQKPQ